MREPGKVSPRKAARLLGVHYNTVIAHCQRSVRGEPSKLKTVSQNPLSGYYLIELEEVITLRQGRQGGSIL